MIQFPCIIPSILCCHYFFILAILTHVLCYFIVIWIYIFCMANDVE